MTTTAFIPTAEHFDTDFDDENTFPFFEDENGDGVYGYGHQHKDDFAELVNVYDRLCTDDDVTDGYTSANVGYHWAVVIPGDTDAADDWSFNWREPTEDTPNAFPVTVILR